MADLTDEQKAEVDTLVSAIKSAASMTQNGAKLKTAFATAALRAAELGEPEPPRPAQLDAPNILELAIKIVTEGYKEAVVGEKLYTRKDIEGSLSQLDGNLAQLTQEKQRLEEKLINLDTVLVK